MPAEIRNFKAFSVDEFKVNIDKFLTIIPDQPVIGNLVPVTCDPITLKPSNSILDWAPTLGRDLKRNLGK